MKSEMKIRKIFAAKLTAFWLLIMIQVDYVHCVVLVFDAKIKMEKEKFGILDFELSLRQN